MPRKGIAVSVRSYNVLIDTFVVDRMPFPFFRSKKSSRNVDSKPLPPAMTKLLRETWWLVLVGATIYLILSMLSFDHADPSWSAARSVDGLPSKIDNWGGWLGARLSDVLYALCGFSAWWLVVLCVAGVWWGYWRIGQDDKDESDPIWLGVLGFIVLLLSSSAFETLLYTWTTHFPQGAGGILGHALSPWLNTVFGEMGAILLLLAFMATGFSLFTGISWLSVMEKLGTLLERLVMSAWNAWQARQDREIGKVESVKREARVVQEKKKIESAEPLRIEMPEPEPAPSPKAEKRIEKEKQPMLFVDDQSLPPLSLLELAPPAQETVSHETLEYTSRLIERKLADFGVEVKVVAAYPGPVITRYEIDPAVGVKGSQIVNLIKDLARALGLVAIRVVETIPGKTYMGLELPNPKRQMVRLSEILSSASYNESSSKLTLVLGKDIGGKPISADLAKMPHVLVAGTTGSGKSVAINAMILSLLYKATAQEVRMIMVDPKMLELSIYEGIPHLLAPVVTDMKHAANALTWCVAEMEKRYKLMSAMGVRNLAGYNQKVKEAEKAGTKLTNPFTLTPDNPEPLETMPLIVVIIDELADLMMVAGKKIEVLIARLAQKARAAGIHLVLATQRPSVDVITGLIKANVPTRISFQVSSKIDSRTILDQMGAEALLGQGDMLFLPPGSGYPQRVHGAFVADEEVHKVVDFLKQQGEPDYVDGILEGGLGGDDGGGIPGLDGEEGGSDAEADPLYDEAVAIVLKTRRASISSVQRALRIGYNRSARLIEQMEGAGIVSSMETNGNRTVLMPDRSE